MKGILGRKAGMTTVFAEDGRAIPVTVIEVKPNSVLQVKTIEKDGYKSIKLGVEDKKDNKAIKAELGIAKKANTSAKYFIREINGMEGFKLGDKIEGNIFESGILVDVTGTSKGKGFQGAIKRHNQTRGPMGHGSKFHRAPGSSGDIRGTVKKTKKMPGHMGHDQTTMQNLQIVDINLELNVILVRGSIPGPNKSFVIIREAIKGQQERTVPINLINVEKEQIKNDLLEQGKKVSADLNTGMSIDEMKVVIEAATIKHDADHKELQELLIEAKTLKINKADKMKLDALRIEVRKVQNLIAARKAKEGAS